jgi:hypothetical protein
LGDVALIEIDRDMAVVTQKARDIGGGLSQLRDKADRDGIIVIQPELQARLIVKAPDRIDGIAHHLPVPARWMGLNNHLRDVRHQRRKPLAMGLGQGFSDHNQIGEILICLGAQAGQGEGFEKPEPFFQPRFFIKIIDARLQIVMFYLKPANPGI